MSGRGRVRVQGRTRVVAIVSGLLAIGGLVTPARGDSVSCQRPGWESARSKLYRSDAAFVGRAVSAEPVDEDDGDWNRRRRWTFEVEETVKGELGEVVEVEAGACGPRELHERRGITLERTEDGWDFGRVLAPEDLRGAAEPLPAPNGEGPARFLVASGWGEVRSLALDADGRTLAYGYTAEPGPARPSRLDVCPGGRHVVELSQPDLAVRDLGTFEVRWGQAVLPELAEPPPVPHFYDAVGCLDERGDEVAVFIRDQAATEARIASADADGVETVAEGVWEEAAFAPGSRTAFVFRRDVDHYAVLALDLDTGARERLARFPHRPDEHLGPPTTSPDGRWVAVTANATAPGTEPMDPRIVLVGVDGTVRERTTERAPRLSWGDGDRLIASFNASRTPERPGEVVLYDTRLRPGRRFSGLSWGRDVALRDGTLYGLRDEALVAAPPDGGPVREVRRLAADGRALMLYPEGADLAPHPGRSPPPTPTPEPASPTPSASPSPSPSPEASPAGTESGGSGVRLVLLLGGGPLVGSALVLGGLRARRSRS